MSKTLFHTASRTWLSAACAKQLDTALAAARAAGRSVRPCANDNGAWRTTPNRLLSGEPWNFITGKSAGTLERLDKWAQSTNLRGGYIKFSKQYIETAPVISPDEAGPETVARLVALVDRMLELNKKKAEERNPEALRRQESDVAITDHLVYQRFALTPEEIAIVEGSKG